MLVKGRSNYLSKRRLRVAQQRLLTLAPDRQAADQLVQIGKWSRRTAGRQPQRPAVRPATGRVGPRRERPRQLPGPQVPRPRGVLLLPVPRAGCTGRTSWSSTTPCSSATWPCGRPGPGSCPDYKVVVFDEAHTLEDVAADHLGLQVNQGGVEYLFNKLLAPRQHRGLLASYGDDQAIAQLEHARQAAERFFQSVRVWQDRQGPRGTGRVRRAGYRAERALRGTHQARQPTDPVCAGV